MTDHSGLNVDSPDFGTEASDGSRDLAGTIRDKGSELGRKVASSIDTRRDAAADGLQEVSQGLHNKADSFAGGLERVSTAAHGAADKVESASRYLRNNSTQDMLHDVESMVRSHPGKSLLAMLAVGYLAGRALRRD